MNLPPHLNTSLQARRKLRDALRARRRALSAARQGLAAQKLAIRLGRHPWVRKANHLALYWPADGEISPLPLLRSLQRRGKTVYLPALNASHKALSFRRYRQGDPLRRNRYGIPEPQTTGGEVPVTRLDTLLMPLVGFDERGNRLGMGGGFYDRTLAKLKTRRPRLIGLAHRTQQVARLQVESWDVPLHAIATDHRFISTRR